MKKLLPLLALIAAPAMAQETQSYFRSTVWPVEASGRVCSTARGPGVDSDPLTISYDAAANEVTLSASTDAIVTRLRENSTVQLAVVFLENGQTAYDDGWGPRNFTFTRDGERARFSTRFKGARNIRQIFADLSSSHHVGFLHDGKPVVSANLAQARLSLDKLRECALRAVAAS